MPSLEVIKYQLDRIETKVDSMERDVNALKLWQAATTALSSERREGIDWPKIVLGLIAVLGTALTIIATRGG